jgi:hypothetical protein
MKRLRESRRDVIERVARRVKEQKKAVETIREQLKGTGQTVPELAEKTGMEPSRVLWLVATLKKYGEVLEGEKDGSYFRYEAATTPAQGPSDASVSIEKG